MTAWEISGGFGLERLRRVDRAPAAPGPGEIALAMRAASLNYRDLLMVGGRYDPRQALPLVPCSDGVGVVTSIGDGVDRFRTGDRACPIFAQRWIAGAPTRDRLRSTLGGPIDGTLRRDMVVPAESAVLVPEHLTDEEASTLPCAALTAWSALVTHGPVRAGDVVLVQGTGGVSVFAIQLAKLAGARVVATSSSHEKLERARALGADHGIHYGEEPAWGKRARALADGGVDVVIEVGGAGTLAQSIAAARIGGRIALIGVLAGSAGEIDLTPAFMKHLTLQGIVVGHRDGFEAMNRAIAASRLRPVVDRVFPFAEAPAAFAHLASGRHLGKVVVRLDV